jgi:serine/threonine-protein kinase RsbW
VSEGPVSVRLELESRPENAALVRAALAGVSEAVELSKEVAADLSTAVSEACNNVAVHAYNGTSGPMVVEIEVHHDGIGLKVSDYGRGIKQVALDEERIGLGLAVISALANRAEFLTSDAGGTEVSMWFAYETGVTDAPGSPVSEPEMFPGVALGGELVAWVHPVSVLRFVLRRVFTTMAARSHFSVTRVSDLGAVNDAIAEYLADAGDGGIGLAISKFPRRLALTGWPVMSQAVHAANNSSTDRFVELENRVQAVEGLIGTLRTETLGGMDLLHVELAEATQRPA